MRAPQVFYFCYDHQRPTGGQKRTYRHVDILRSSGFAATVVHQQPGFRLSWFDNTTPVVSVREFTQVFDEAEDFVVLPEDLGLRILSWPGRKIIFNKGIFKGFAALGPDEPLQSPYCHPDVVCAFTISEHNRAYLQNAYPDLTVYKVTTGIDSEVFQFKRLLEKEPVIACCPKGPEELLTIYHAIRARARRGLNGCQKYRWVFLKGLSEREIARTLADAIALVYLGFEEGFARMPVEAMMCGCLIAGHQVGALSELPPFAFNLPVGDVQTSVTMLEQLLDERSPQWDRWQQEASRNYRLAQQYSLGREEANVLDVWRTVLRVVQPPTTASETVE